MKMESKLATKKKFTQISEKSNKTKKNNFIKKPNNIILGAAANSIVTTNIEPS